MNPSLEHFVTDTQAPVYCIRNLPEEVSSVLFAYVSRSPNSFRQNLEALLGEEGIQAGAASEAFDPASDRARAFHEKWVVGYGHSSVAEHSVLRYGLEGVSILATKLIEDNRLASYTEKSTRYQYFGRDTWLRDPTLAASPFGAECEQRLNGLMDLYRETFEKLDAHLRRKHPARPGARPALYEAALKAQVCDAARYLLPLATRTMLAVTVNARAAAWMITKLLSHPLAEARLLGLAMREQGRRVCPTLLRHADENRFLQGTPGLLDAALPELAGQPTPGSNPAIPHATPPSGNGVRLLDHQPDALERVLEGLLYERGGRDLASLRHSLASLAPEPKARALHDLAAAMGQHDRPPRAFERARYTFELTVDYGAFRDIQRHRMGTQLNPPLTDELGYEVPVDVEESGCAPAFREGMERAAELYRRVAPAFPEQAPYLLPLAFRKRALFDWDLRQVAHFVRLRSAREGHISYRRLAWEMRDAVVAVHPWAAPFLTVDREMYPLGRLADHAAG
jgi:thymidylate synthase ThyX